jgi:hypothetical protein
MLRSLPAKRVVLFLDACHAAGVGGDEGEEVMEVKKVNHPIHSLAPSSSHPLTPLEGGSYGQLLDELSSRYLLFASCAADQLSYEDPLNLEGGVFGHYLADGLSGAGDEDRDGVVRLNEVIRYVTTEVQGWCRTNLEPDDRPQRPVRLPTGGADDFAVASDPLRTRAVAAEAALRRLAGRLTAEERRDAEAALNAGTDRDGRLNVAGSVFAEWVLEVDASLSAAGSPPERSGADARHENDITLDRYRAYRRIVAQSPESAEATLYRLLPPRLALMAVARLDQPGEAGRVWRDQAGRLRQGELSPEAFGDWMDDWLQNTPPAPL